jgi:hypothetical protein
MFTLFFISALPFILGWSIDGIFGMSAVTVIND